MLLTDNDVVAGFQPLEPYLSQFIFNCVAHSVISRSSREVLAIVDVTHRAEIFYFFERELIVWELRNVFYLNKFL